jgi:hypothetical protein
MRRKLEPLVLAMFFAGVSGSAAEEGVSALADSAAAPDTAAAPADSAETDRFRSTAAGVEVRKPHGWFFADLQTVLEQRAHARLKSEEFERLVRENASIPLVVATKYEEPYDALNPSFQMIVRPAGTLEGKPAVEIMTAIENGLRNVFAQYETVEPIREIRVGGRSGARFTAAYTVSNPEGREFAVRSTLVLVPRGKILYQMGFSGTPEGPDRLGEEIESVLASIRFLD